MEPKNLPDIDKLEPTIADNVIPLSLRVKESTKAFLETEAIKSNVSINVLINSLLDIYANHYIADAAAEKEAKMQALRSYLEIATEKSSTLDFETLLLDTIELYQPDIMFGRMYDIAFDDLIKDCAAWAEGEPTQYFKNSAPDFYTADGLVYAIPLGEKAHVEWEELSDGTSRADCYLRIDYWIVLMTIISAYKTKLAELFPDWSSYLGEQFTIAQFANTTSNREEFAQTVMGMIVGNFELQQPEAAERRRAILRSRHSSIRASDTNNKIPVSDGSDSKIPQ